MISGARSRLIGRLRTRRGRPREGLFLVEGLRSAEEALAAPLETTFAAVSSSLRESDRGAALEARLRKRGIDVELVDDREMEELADTETPQGVLLVCREPEFQLDDLASRRVGGFLVLDAVQDPGNLGTLVRAARAFGLASVVALDGTVDPWNPKAVRASAGASFRIPLLKEDWRRVAAWLRGREIPLLASSPDGVNVARAEVGDTWALAVGNEGAGVRPGVRKAADQVVSVPMAGGVDSLNAGVAGAILLYELTRYGRA